MSFWSSQRIETNLARLTDHPEPDMVDCNSLTLRVGPEVYVTPGLEQPAPNSHTRARSCLTESGGIPEAAGF